MRLDLEDGDLVEHRDLNQERALLLVEFATPFPLPQFSSDYLFWPFQLPKILIVLLVSSAIFLALNLDDLADLFDLLVLSGRQLGQVWHLDVPERLIF